MTCAFRLVPWLRAGTAFSGEGARLYGGRWNSPGLPAVYLSEHRSLAALETLIHQQERIPTGIFAVFEINFDDALIETISSEALPLDWFKYPAAPATKLIGDNWLKNGKTPVLRVPSVAVIEESNFLFNPRHPASSKVVVGEPARFAFDRRLLAKSA